MVGNNEVNVNEFKVCDDFNLILLILVIVGLLICILICLLGDYVGLLSL